MELRERKNMTNRVDSKTAVLAILDILKKYSNVKTPLTIQDILEIMIEKYGLKAHRDTVKNTLSKMQEYYGDDVVRCKISDRNTNDEKKANEYTSHYYFNHTMSDDDIKIMIDSIMFSKMLTEEKVKVLTKKLKKYATEDYQKQLEYLYMVPDKQFILNTLTLDNITVIHQVLYENRYRKYDSEKRIVFHFNGYGSDKKLHQTRRKEYEVLPLKVCEANHKYYLICYSEGKPDLSHYRIDLMTHLRVLEYNDLERDSKKEHLLNQLSTKTLSGYMNEHLYMMYGDPKQIKLEIRKDKGDASLTCLHDAFGEKWKTLKEDNDKVTVSVKCTVQAMKIWVMQYIHKVKVIGPDDVKRAVDEAIISSLESYIKQITE